MVVALAAVASVLPLALSGQSRSGSLTSALAHGAGSVCGSGSTHCCEMPNASPR